MENLLKFFSFLMMITLFVPNAALAKGEITLEQADGNVDIYSDLEILRYNSVPLPQEVYLILSYHVRLISYHKIWFVVVALAPVA